MSQAGSRAAGGGESDGVDGVAEQEADAIATAEEGDPTIDWIAAEESPEFQELIAKRKRFIIPSVIFFLGWYTVFVLLAGYAPDFMASSVYEGLTVGYVLALTQFVMVWVLGGLYLRKSRSEFDPLSRKAAQTALEAGRRKAREQGAGRDSGRGAGTTGEVPAR